MVQNPIDPPRIEKPQPSSFAVSRKRSRQGSQPIQPLKLPRFPQTHPSNRHGQEMETRSVAAPTLPDPLPNQGDPNRGYVEGRDGIYGVHGADGYGVHDFEQNEFSQTGFSRSPKPTPGKQPKGDQIKRPSRKHSFGVKTLQRGATSVAISATTSLKQGMLSATTSLKQGVTSATTTVSNQVTQASLGVYKAVAPTVIHYSTVLKPSPETQRWLLIWFSVLGSFAGVTSLAFLWLASPPPTANCRRVTIDSPGVQRLHCAQELARTGKLSDLATGIDLLEQWAPDQPFYRDAQNSIADWSALILVIARNKLNQSDLQGAIDAVNQIPETSPVYPEAQEAIAAWKQEWQEGEAIVATAQEAIKSQNWRLASDQVVELGYLSHDYWRLKQADVLFKQIVREKTARESLTQAQKLAKGNDPNKLGEAITLLRKVAPNTYATTEAEAALKQWSQTLTDFALEQWRNGDTEGAFATATKIPFDPNLPSAGRDLIQLSQASELAEASLSASGVDVSVEQIWNLMEAISAIEQIAPDSPFYADAQAVSATWNANLQDMTQLGFASLVAHWGGDRSALELAIAQANQISAERPRRLQAQTLIAQWQQGIHSLDDLPYLARAKQWAALGTIPDLKAAIAQVSVIPNHRAAWTQAQTLIAQWTASIQTIEDQPTWDQAQKLAKQGKLNEAIAIATKIQPNRALYDEAQAAISAWRGKIRDLQIAEDQPILDRAYGLAARERLTMAIDVASQIGPGRALYDEAQAAIESWADQRDGIWKSWEGSPPSEGSSATAATNAENSSIDNASTDTVPTDDSVDYSSDYESVDNDATGHETASGEVWDEAPESNDFSGDSSADVSGDAGYEGYYDETYYDNAEIE